MLTGLQMKLIGTLVVALIFAGLLTTAHYWKGRAHKAEAQIIEFQKALTAVRTTTAAAKAADAAHAKVVETDNAMKGKESVHDYKASLADLQQRYDRLLQRKPSTNFRGGRDKTVPSTSTNAEGTCPAFEEGGLPPADALIASQQALQLQAILDWGRKVGIIR